LLLVVFVVVEARRRAPMLPLAIFRSRQFSATNLTTLFVYAGLAMVFFMLGLVLQLALGYSPVAAGAATFPITAIMLVFSSRTGALAQKIGPRWPMTVGPLTIAAGLLLMLRIEPGHSYASVVLPAVLVFAGGLALTVAPLTATVLAAADPQHSGVASGVNNAVARVGGLLAVAAIPLVAGFHPSTGIATGELVQGFHTALRWAAGLVALGGVIAFANIRSSVLATATVDDATPIDQRHPNFHCGSDAPPLVALTEHWPGH
jgi:predicted MFS family arabinose efflux permease